MVWLGVSPAITSNPSTRVAPSDWRSFVHYVSRKLEFLRLVAVVQAHVVLVYGRTWSDQQITGSLHLFRAWLQCLYHQNHSTHGWLVGWLVDWLSAHSNLFQPQGHTKDHGEESHCNCVNGYVPLPMFFLHTVAGWKIERF